MRLIELLAEDHFGTSGVGIDPTGLNSEANTKMMSDARQLDREEAVAKGLDPDDIDTGQQRGADQLLGYKLNWPSTTGQDAVKDNSLT